MGWLKDLCKNIKKSDSSNWYHCQICNKQLVKKDILSVIEKIPDDLPIKSLVIEIKCSHCDIEYPIHIHQQDFQWECVSRNPADYMVKVQPTSAF